MIIFNNVFKMDTHLHVDVPMESADIADIAEGAAKGSDTHGGVIAATDTQSGVAAINLRAAMEKAGLNAVGMTFAVDYVKLKYPGHAYERFMNALTEQERILENSGLKLTLNIEQLEERKRKGEPIVIQEVEGAHFLEGDVSRIQTAYNRGLRIFCLLHDNDADPALGDVYTNKPQYGGLTQLGADTIRECERLGILVDLAHCDDNTVRMALDVATKPVLISHTGLNTQLGTDKFMAGMMYPRLITPEMAKVVADKGGVIGIWPHLANSAEEYAANLDAMVKVVGIDHVCIGTDTKITPEFNEFNDMKFAEENKEAKENEESKEAKFEITEEMRRQFADDEKNGIHKEMPRQNLDAANHVWNDDKDSFYFSVIRELVKIGYNEEDIGKITGDNFCRVFGDATRRKEATVIEAK